MCSALRKRPTGGRWRALYAGRLHRLPRMALPLLAAVLLLGAGSQLAIAQAPPANKAPEKPKLPAPIEVGGSDLQTRDGVLLKAWFYPSPKTAGPDRELAKDVVPIILLHTWKGDHKEYTNLAPYLQTQGHAVLVPDLRGHGESQKQRLASGDRTLDASRFGPDDFARMVQFDMERLKAYLVCKNNNRELNIEKLCIVGAEMGACIALDWAQLDWSWPILPGHKQGQDVKALVLLTPQWGFPGLNIRAALNDPAVVRELSILMLAGIGDHRSVSETTRLHTVLERFHPEPSQAEIQEKKDLFFFRPETKLQGTKLLDLGEIKMRDEHGDEFASTAELMIAQFIEFRLVKKSYSWTERN